MHCVNCGEEMVECLCGPLIVQSLEEDNEPAPKFLGLDLPKPQKNRTYANEGMACPACGLLLAFVHDPSVFRPKETRDLPQAAELTEVDRKRLPRPAEVSEN